MLAFDMAPSAKDSFELASRTLREKERGLKVSKKTGSAQRSQTANMQSKQARESCDAHSHDLFAMKKFASDAAENLTAGRERQRKRDAAKVKRTALKRKVA